jgi:PAS domain-containing protein
MREAFLRLPREGTFEEEYRIVRPDGEVRWIHDRAFPVRDAAGGSSASSASPRT